MPHTALQLEELDRLFPSLVAPPEPPLQDLVDDTLDNVYQHGLRIAKDIQEEVNEQGRKRHPEAKKITSPTKPDCIGSVRLVRNRTVTMRLLLEGRALPGLSIAGRVRG